jgi:acetoin utilization deacetylase AcuC-like enzyme
MQMTEAGYAALTRVLMQVANEHADGRVAAILEGGYDLHALGASAAAVLDELGGCSTDAAIATPRPHAGVLAPAVAAQQPYWDLRAPTP